MIIATTRYFKMICTVCTFKKTVSRIAHIVYYYRFNLNGILHYLLIDNDAQIASKL